MTCVVVKAQWGLHPRGMNARVPGYTGFIPSAKAEATKGLKPLVGPRAAWRWKAHGPPSIPWPGACAGALNQRSWSTCRNPWRTLDGIRTTRRHLASGCRSCRDLKWLDLAASGWHFHTSNTHFMEDSNMFSVKNHEKFDQITQMYSMEGISTYIKSHKIPNVPPKRFCEDKLTGHLWPNSSGRGCRRQRRAVRKPGRMVAKTTALHSFEPSKPSKERFSQ